mgnify:CR=1 FL=1
MPRATKKPKTTKEVKLRKPMDNVDHMAILSDYMKGELSVSEIAEKYKTTTDNVGLIASRSWKALTNMRESRVLLQTVDGVATHYDVKKSLQELNGTELINEAFLKKLSDPKDALLTDEEATYCWIYVHAGDQLEAVSASGLDVGLFKGNPETKHSGRQRTSRFSYERAVNLRVQYLNAKPNIAEYIKELRETRLVNADVGKALVQSELLDQLEKLKARSDARYTKDILRTIELLGKTIGAFTERVEISEVNPADSLDKLIEMAQEASVKELPKSDSTEVTQ